MQKETTFYGNISFKVESNVSDIGFRHIFSLVGCGYRHVSPNLTDEDFTSIQNYDGCL